MPSLPANYFALLEELTDSISECAFAVKGSAELLVLGKMNNDSLSMVYSSLLVSYHRLLQLEDAYHTDAVKARLASDANPSGGLCHLDADVREVQHV